MLNLHNYQKYLHIAINNLHKAFKSYIMFKNFFIFLLHKQIFFKNKQIFFKNYANIFQNYANIFKLYVTFKNFMQNVNCNM